MKIVIINLLIAGEAFHLSLSCLSKPLWIDIAPDQPNYTNLNSNKKRIQKSIVTYVSTAITPPTMPHRLDIKDKKCSLSSFKVTRT